MLTENQISQLVKEKVEILKRSQFKKKMPIYHTSYEVEVEMKQRIDVHSRYDYFPEKLFKTKAPSEQENEFHYRKATYKPFTQPYWNKSLSVLNRVWNEQNYSIAFNEDDRIYSNATSYQYFYEEYPIYTNIVDYFKSIVTREKINDPNAIIAIRPSALPLIEDADGNLTVDDTQLISPVGVIFHSEQIREYKMKDMLMVELKQKSIVNTGNSKFPKKEGII